MNILPSGSRYTFTLPANNQLTVTSRGGATVTGPSGLLGTVDGTSTFGAYSTDTVITVAAVGQDCSYGVIEPSNAQLTTTPSGGAVITAPGSGSIAFPGAVPRGMSWLNDSISGFDIYSKGFVETPNIFFDPSKAATSLNRGTFRHPYTTQAQLQAVIKGDMHGKKLGMARGTKLQVTGTNGLNFAGVYGASGDPFMIIPYGDAEALPIISSESAVTTWALCSGSTTIYKYTLATESDIWQNGTRVWKLNPTSGSTNNNTGTTVNSEATAVTALSAKGQGWSVYYGGVLYFYPYSGEDPNLGQCSIDVSDFALQVKYSDVLASGNIWIVGLDVRRSRNTPLQVLAAGTSAAQSASGIKIVGCRIGSGGVDNGSSGACDALSIYGISDTYRITPYVAGNYFHGVFNNALEIAGTTGAIGEFNTSYNCGGNSICELWASNDNATLRFNKGEYSSLLNRRYQSFAQGGVWFANYYETGGVWTGAAGQDATHAKNHDNQAYFNLIINPRTRAVKVSGGTGHKFQHNTGFFDSDLLYGAGNSNSVQGWFTENDAATGFIDISNNLFYWKDTTEAARYPNFCRIDTNPLGSAASVPSGNNNVYFTAWTANNGTFYYNGVGTPNFTTYKTALSAYSLDQNSLTDSTRTGGTLTDAALGFDEATYTPLAANAAGLTSLTGIGTRYQDGQPYVAASATIGALLGT